MVNNKYRDFSGRLEYSINRNGNEYFVKNVAPYRVSRFDPNAVMVTDAVEILGTFILDIPAFPSFIQAVAYLKSHAENLI